MTFSGPKEGEDEFLAALTDYGLAAEHCGPMYPEEAQLSWVRVLTHEGEDDPPGAAFQQHINEKADTIANSFGFTHRAHGITL